MTLRNRFPSVEESCTSIMDTFDPLSVSVNMQLLNRSSNVSFEADPMLISVKAPLVKPLIKRHNLDCNVLNNYPPVSNLSYFSEITERAVAVQLSKYLLDSNLSSQDSLDIKLVIVPKQL